MRYVTTGLPQCNYGANVVTFFQNLNSKIERFTHKYICNYGNYVYRHTVRYVREGLGLFRERWLCFWKLPWLRSYAPKRGFEPKIFLPRARVASGFGEGS